ncbi:hypothetical protein ZIOFF_031769 [Zingiber officinale]|uniref:Uncharacterized protein n=1 Tax=Zingiber officinale TaxID=94328 RepID=A0A8J5GI51_ZINOF|nr:hypothetical protein ZIOFF_031769 [Zingiber officinale]
MRADSLPGFGSKPRADSSPNSKEAPLWKDVNFADANLLSPSVEPHPSQLESSEAVQVKSVFTRSYALMESMHNFAKECEKVAETFLLACKTIQTPQAQQLAMGSVSLKIDDDTTCFHRAIL